MRQPVHAATGETDDRSRALGRGSGRLSAGRAGAGKWVLGVVGIVAGVVALIIALGGGGGGAAGHSRAARYGGLPSWLPKPTVHVDRLVTATRLHPWLAIEGDTVHVVLAHGQVMATAVGPSVPEEGRFPVPATTPCSFTVTLTRASGSFPVSAKAFTIVGETGRLYHPRVRVAGGGPLPPGVMPGRTVNLTVSAVLPTGAGQLRWAPGGGKPISAWDFDVEID